MNVNIELIKKAEKLGFKALVITIDAPISGIRNAEQRAGFYFPNGISATNIENINSIQTSNNFENINLIKIYYSNKNKLEQLHISDLMNKESQHLSAGFKHFTKRK